MLSLTRAGVRFSVHPYAHDPNHPSYGEEAAEALGVAPSTVFKTLLADVASELVVAVVPVTASLDLKALATAAGVKKATLADPGRAERATGYVVGGISPLGQRKHHRTFVDESAATLPTVYVSGGHRGLDLGLSPLDLIRLTEARLAPLAR